MTEQFKDQRTILGKTYTAHDIAPYIADYCADWGRSIGVEDWFPSKDDWPMVNDWLGDFGELPKGWDTLTFEQRHDFLEAVAKEYVGYTEKDDEPDPFFWDKMIDRFGSSKLKEEWFADDADIPGDFGTHQYHDIG